MPWTAENATEPHNNKLKTPAQKAKWAAIANSALKTYKGAEGKAIATANAAFDGIPALRAIGFFDHDDDKLMKMVLGGDDHHKVKTSQLHLLSSQHFLLLTHTFKPFSNFYHSPPIISFTPSLFKFHQSFILSL